MAMTGTQQLLRSSLAQLGVSVDQPSVLSGHPLLQRLLGQDIDALALSLRLDRELLMQLWRNAKVEFAREIAPRLEPLFLADLKKDVK